MKLNLFKFKNRDSVIERLYIGIYRRPQPYLKRLWICGRLYRGYIGIMAFWGSLNFDLWIYYPDKELRKVNKEDRKLSHIQPV